MLKSIFHVDWALIIQMEHEKCLEMMFLSNAHFVPTLVFTRLWPFEWNWREEAETATDWSQCRSRRHEYWKKIQSRREIAPRIRQRKEHHKKYMREKRNTFCENADFEEEWEMEKRGGGSWNKKAENKEEGNLRGSAAGASQEEWARVSAREFTNERAVACARACA